MVEELSTFNLTSPVAILPSAQLFITRYSRQILCLPASRQLIITYALLNQGSTADSMLSTIEGERIGESRAIITTKQFNAIEKHFAGVGFFSSILMIAKLVKKVVQHICSTSDSLRYPVIQRR